MDGIETILPPAVSAVVVRRDVEGAELFPGEAAAIARAVEPRRREFATGRWCARAALTALGFPPQPVPVDPDGAPRWPTGVVGSITHCAGYRACAVARASRFTGIGIDAEPDAPLPRGLLEAIALSEEQASIHELGRCVPQRNWDRLLFSIKEAVYKACSPLTENRLGFEDATIVIDPHSASFRARLRPPRHDGLSDLPDALAGHWLVADGVILTATTVPAPPASRRAQPPVTGSVGQ